jgi:hydroxymethylbilane synthase
MIPKIGTRKSKLALVYTGIAKEAIQMQLETVLIDSTADLNPTTSIEEMGGKGVFTKEREQALIDGDIDIACHAFKDLTRDNDHLLEIPCVVRRGDVRDCLVGNEVNPRTIGTSSPRRIAQLKDLYPNAEIVPIRGNLDTRIQKVDNGEYDAICVAVAGLDAALLSHRASRVFGTADMMPAPGQGVIALQMRIDNRMKGALSNVNHWHTWYMAMAEKEMLRVIDGNCQTPVGSVSVLDGPNIKIVAKNFETGKIAVQSAPMKEYKELGQMLGSQLI